MRAGDFLIRPNSVIAVACPASSCSWSGGGVRAGTFIWTSNGNNGGNGPITVSLGSWVAGARRHIEVDGGSAFTAEIQAFNTACASLGALTENSNYNGDAIFVGISDTTAANITSTLATLMSAMGSVSDFALDTPNFSDRDFRPAIQQYACINRNTWADVIPTGRFVAEVQHSVKLNAPNIAPDHSFVMAR